MRKINYPLIISDFDGTLLRSDGTIAPETRREIDEYIKNGGIFAISTGRMLSSILLKTDELGLKGLVSAYNGSMIVDIESREFILNAGLTPEEASDICKVLEEENLHVHLYNEWDFYSNQNDEKLRWYEEASGVKGIVFNEKASEFILKNTFSVKKVLTVVTPEERIPLYERLSKRLGDKYYVMFSSDRLIEILHKSYSKGTAVQFLADYYGVPVEKTVGVGDNFNDLPMIQAAGVGIAVKNADISLKQKVEPYAYSNDEDAIGHIIRQYGYTKE